MGSRVFYVTREEVMDAFDVKEAANRSAQIDAAIASSSDDVDGWLNRHKHGVAPTRATRYFDWPMRDQASSFRVWFDENELVSIDTFTSGGNALAPGTDYFLEPVNSGPPFTYVEINQGSGAAFDSAPSGTWQRAIQIVGTWGIGDDQTGAGALTEALDASQTDVQVSDASLVGVGSVLLVDDERMLVTERAPIDTGDTVQTAMTALKSNQTLALTSGASVHRGEIVTVDDERMKVLRVSGNNATVLRAYDGTILATHDIGTAVLADRELTVERAALGTAAATHLDGAPVTRWVVPELIRDLAKAAAITRLEQEWSAYGARVYSDEAERDSSGTDVVAGRGLTDIRISAARRYKRKFRVRAV